MAVYRGGLDMWDELGEVRGRISVVAWAVALATASALFLRLPTVVLTFHVLGSPATVAITNTTWMALLAGILAGSGAEGVLRIHPRWRRDPAARWWQRWIYWALPAALGVLGAWLTPMMPSRLLAAMAVVAGSGLLAVALYALYNTVEPGVAGFRRNRVVLNVLAYGATLALFLLVYRTRTRSLLSGTLIAATGTLLAVELLRTSTDQVGAITAYAAAIGLLLGEMTWALNYWALPGLTGGLVLLLAFYVMVTVTQQSLQGRLTRRVLVELAVFSLLVLFLLAFLAPGLE